jgi:hypothetical protein
MLKSFGALLDDLVKHFWHSSLVDAYIRGVEKDLRH